jgi:UDPglucose 6-dehydrogenase
MGLWHLGCVVSACLSEIKEITVTGLDFDNTNIANLNNGIPPIFEPGLVELIQKNIGGSLKYTDDTETAVSNADYLWIAYDTPVDENDNADVSAVVDKVVKTFPYINTNMGIIVSSQLPVGTTRHLKNTYFENFSAFKPVFAYSPENLRLGRAIDVFTNPDRVVIGTDYVDKDVFEKLFLCITDKLEWMCIESAEMTKHAINAFLATSAVFANEIATLCEYVGADAKEVERGLKTEQRIGSKAYVAPGGAIAGGTLNRDIVFLNKLGDELKIKTDLLMGVKKSNDKHKSWHKNKLKEELGDLKNKKIGILGLTYKAGTNTLRRSLAVELCRELSKEGAYVFAYDPSLNVAELDEEYNSFINISDSIESVFDNSDGVVICTEWPEFKNCLKITRLNLMNNRLIIDSNGFFDDENELFRGQIKHIILGKGDSRDETVK